MQRRVTNKRRIPFGYVYTIQTLCRHKQSGIPRPGPSFLFLRFPRAPVATNIDDGAGAPVAELTVPTDTPITFDTAGAFEKMIVGLYTSLTIRSRSQTCPSRTTRC